MGRTAWSARVCAAVALMASCLAVTASAQQASVPPAPAGSTPSTASTPEWPTSVDRVRDGLSREPVLRLDTQPIFRLEVNERRPRYWDLESLFLFEPEPRGFSGPWHDQFLSMTTPDEARMYGPMNSSGETAQLVATGLLFQGAVKLVQSGVQRWRKGRREGKARAAREEVDAALAAWEAANLAHPQQP